MTYTTFDLQKMYYFGLILVGFFAEFQNVKSKYLGCEFKYFLCYLLARRFPKTRITRENKKIFFLIDKEQG